MKNSIVVLSCLLAASGCVSSRKFTKLQSDAQELSTKLAAAEQRATELQASLTRLDERADSLSKERDSLQQANADLSKSLGAKQDELSKLNARLQSDLTAARLELTQTQGKAANLESKVTEFTAQLDQTTVKAAQLATEREQLQEANASLSKSLGSTQNELSKTVAKLSEDKRTLEARVAELSKTAEELKAKQDRELAQTKATYESLMGELKQEVSKGQVQITQMQGKLSVNVADTIFFDSGKADIKDSGRKVLERVGGILSHISDKQIRIEGHTDDVPIRGTLKERYASNWELSAARATMVARFLQEKAKVDGALLIAAGYGEYRPVAPNDTEAGRAKNRRIEIVLIDKELGRAAR
ncbi:MAG: OmpA family protein [Elusimicrobiota bacterium]